MGPGIMGKDLRIIRELALISQLRGLDGAGIYQVNSRVETGNMWSHEKLLKTGDNMSSLITKVEDDRSVNKNGKYGDTLDNIQVDVIMGHVRAATKGNITDKNAHPFSFSNIVACHNGTLRDKKYEHEHKTDSELMFNDINERGIVPVLSDLDRFSAYALSIYDKRDRNMYFVRNNDRTLAMCFVKARGVMYWASELDMLRYVLDKFKEPYRACTLFPFKVVKVKASDITPEKINSEGEEYLKILTSSDTLVDNTPIRQSNYVYPNSTVRQTVIVSKKEELSTTVSNNVIPFGRQSKKPIEDELSTCACGSHKFKSLLEQSLASRNRVQGLRFDPETAKVYCDECSTNLEKKVEENAVG